MSTRTAPSERPRMAAISRVDISSTKRSTSARRRSSGSRSMACQARASASRSLAVRGRVVGGGDQLGRLERRLGAAAQAAALVGDGVAGDLEEPDAEGERSSVAALVEARQGRQRAQEDVLGQVLGTWWSRSS